MNFSKQHTVEEVYTVSYKEGTYDDNISKFSVAPYLTAYILGYAKMLMFISLDWLVRRGAKLLYTDTGSMAFAATPDIYKDYEKEYVWHNKKSFGAMELEEKDTLLIQRPSNDSHALDLTICGRM